MTFPRPNLAHLFKYHPPQTDMEIERYRRIREAGKVFAQVILNETPGCADQSVALRSVREAVMWANASIALNGDPLTPPS